MKRRIRNWLQVGVVLSVIGGLTGVARADADSEREKLAVISNELVRLQELVADASKHADGTARVKFRYDYLLSDLKLVQDGVTTHLDAPRQPRAIPPLKGEYRR
jgi:RAQPRD family integrative conjugative element protein